MASSDFVEDHNRKKRIILHALHQGQYRKLAKDNISNIHIYETTGRCKEKFAVKKVILSETRDPWIAKSLMNEGALLKEMEHPNILPVYQFFTTGTLFARKLTMFLPYVAGGDLLPYTHDVDDKVGDKIGAHTLAKPVTPSQIGSIMAALVNAVWYLHNIANVVHRDIKPDNILIELDEHGNPDFSKLKLCDFGYAEHVLPDKDRFVNVRFDLDGNPGTMHYAAPEVFGDRQTPCPRASDCWSLGVTFFVLAEKYLPFPGETLDQIRLQVCKKEIGPSSFVRFRDSLFVAIVTGLLERRCADRLSMTDVKKMIEKS